MIFSNSVFERNSRGKSMILQMPTWLMVIKPINSCILGYKVESEDDGEGEGVGNDVGGGKDGLPGYGTTSVKYPAVAQEGAYSSKTLLSLRCEYRKCLARVGPTANRRQGDCIHFH
jgi:hypothetical protein